MAKIQINDSKVYKVVEFHARSVLKDLKQIGSAYNQGIVFPKFEGYQVAFMQYITIPPNLVVGGLFEVSLAEYTTADPIIDAELKKLQKFDEDLKEKPLSFDFSSQTSEEIVSYRLSVEPMIRNAVQIHEKGGVEGLRTLIDESKETLKQIENMWIDGDDELNMLDIIVRPVCGQKWTLPSFEEKSKVFRSNANVFREFILKAYAAEKSVQEKFDKNLRAMEYLSALGSFHWHNEKKLNPNDNDMSLDAIAKMRFTMEYDHFQKRVDSMKDERHLLQSKLESARIDLNKRMAAETDFDQQAIDEIIISLREDTDKFFALEKCLRSSYEFLMYSSLTDEGYVKYFGKREFGHSLSYESREVNVDVRNVITEQAFDCFTTLMESMQESKKFYNELKKIMTNFVNEVNDFCSKSKMEREDFVKCSKEKPSEPMPSTSSAYDDA